MKRSIVFIVISIHLLSLPSYGSNRLPFFSSFFRSHEKYDENSNNYNSNNNIKQQQQQQQQQRQSENPLFVNRHHPSLGQQNQVAIYDNQVIAAIVKGFMDITVAILYVRAVHHLINSILKPFEKSNSTMIPSNLIHYFPENCYLNPHELEILENVIDPNDFRTDFNHVGGLEQTKTLLQEFMVDILSYDLFGINTTTAVTTTTTTTTLKPAQAFLLYGPPGNGKTSLVYATSSYFKLPMISIVPSTLMRKYVGESNKMVKSVFTLAIKMQPCVLFIDEIDSLLRARTDDDHSSDRNVKMEFMQLWDDLVKSKAKVVIFGATNRPQDLDPAIHRRFERSVLIPPPDYEDRLEILETILSELDVHEEFNYELCAELTKGYSSSDILAVCKAAKAKLQREYYGLYNMGNVTELSDMIRKRKNHPSMSNITISSELKLRPIETKDIEDALKSVYPTAWSSKSYGTISSKQD